MRFAFEEHMLRAAEANAVGPKGNGVGGLFGRVGVGANAHAGGLGAPVHELLEVLVGLALAGLERFLDEHLHDFGGCRGNLAGVDFARSAVDREEVAFLVGAAVDGHGLGGVIDLQRGGSANAHFAHLAGDQRGVRADPALGGENAFGSDHAPQIFGRGFVADQQNLFALLGCLHGTVGVHVHPARGSAGAGGKTLRDDLRAGHRFAVENRGQNLLELVGRDAFDCCLPVDEFFLFHFNGKANGGEAGALSVARLEHENLVVLNGEFEILHILKVFLELRANAFQFVKRLGHVVLQVGHGFGSADAGDDVFALRVDEELAVENFFAGGGIARERDARAGLVAGVAVDHRLDVDGSAPLRGDVVLATVDDGAVVHPGTEHGADCAPELLPGILGKF